MRWAEHVARLERREMHIGFWWESQKERDHYEDEDVGRRIILKWILELYDGGMDWIGEVQDRDQWRTLVNTVMRGNSWIASQLAVSQEGLGSMECQLYPRTISISL
jgi:hypothetical protein